MTLDEQINHMLTANTKGLQKLRGEINTLADEIKATTEKGDLAALKVKLADLRGKVGTLDKLCMNIEARLTQLTTDEKGGILDLSVPADRRK